MSPELPTRAGYRYLNPRKLANLGKIHLVARGVVEGFVTGLHKSPYHGFSIEFSEHRDYAPGDPLRAIDWRTYARTERLYIKLFEDETNVRVYLLIDRSASMGYKSSKDGLSKLEYACYLAGSLAWLLIRQQDAVGLVSFDEQIRDFIGAASTTGHLRRLAAALEDIKARNKTTMTATFHDVAEKIKRRSLLVIFSDLYEDAAQIFSAMSHFAARKHEVLLFHTMDRQELQFDFNKLAEFVDMETGERLLADPLHIRGEYLKQLEVFQSEFKRRAMDLNCEYIPVNTDVPFEILLGQFLRRRASMG
ncbi:MAG: DUF58 domain-containing protein [Planctomycetota bacterium]